MATPVVVILDIHLSDIKNDCNKNAECSLLVCVD